MWDGVCFVSTPAHTIDFQPQFSQAAHPFTTLGVHMQHPYSAHDKLSVPILDFSPSGWLLMAIHLNNMPYTNICSFFYSGLS
jgi:hypothetical protein